MEKNVGNTDRLIRYILAIVSAYYGSQLNNMWLYFLAIIFLVTAWLQSCMLYTLLGIDTAKNKKVRRAPIARAKKVVKKTVARKATKKVVKKKVVKKKATKKRTSSRRR